MPAVLSSTRRRVAASALALAVVLAGATGCSSDDDGADADTTTTTAAPDEGVTVDPGTDDTTPSSTIPAADATKEDYVAALASSLGSSGTFDEDQTTCMAEGIVDTVGYEKWVESGVSPSIIGASGNPFADLGLTAADGEALYAVLDECSGGFYESSVTSMIQGDESMRACVEEAMSEDQLKDVFISTFTGGEGDTSAFSADLQACQDG
jgi:hypothetical protein